MLVRCFLLPVQAIQDEFLPVIRRHALVGEAREHTSRGAAASRLPCEGAHDGHARLPPVLHLLQVNNHEFNNIKILYSVKDARLHITLPSACGRYVRLARVPRITKQLPFSTCSAMYTQGSL
eukprot:805024-Pleurochrysis_carterae.AAC.1